MQFRKAMVLVILFLSLAVLGTFCESQEVANQTPKALTALIIVKPGLKVEPRAIQALADKVLEDNAYLAGSFSRKDFIGMAKRLGERGASLLSHKYEKQWGKHSAEFWQASWKAGASLEVVTVGIMVTDIIGRRTVPKCLPDEGKVVPVTYDLAATVVQEFHVKEPAPAAHNATTLGGSIYRHQDTCIWE